MGAYTIYITATDGHSSVGYTLTIEAESEIDAWSKGHRLGEKKHPNWKVLCQAEKSNAIPSPATLEYMRNA